MGQGLAAGEFDEGGVGALSRGAEALLNFIQQIFQLPHGAVEEGVLGVTVDAAQRAAREPDEQAGTADAGALPLDAVEHLIDLELHPSPGSSHCACSLPGRTDRPVLGPRYRSTHRRPPSRVRISPVMKGLSAA